MSDDKLHDAQVRGSRAEELLRSELLAECFMTLENAYIKAWRETTPRDEHAREKLWLAVQVVGKVRDHLTNVAADGRVAQKDIDRLAERQAFLSRVGDQIRNRVA